MRIFRYEAYILNTHVPKRTHIYALEDLWCREHVYELRRISNAE